METYLSSTSPHEQAADFLADRSIWPDEVEQLAKIIAVLKSIRDQKDYDWRKELPSRFVEGATVAESMSTDQSVAIRRALSAQLDGFVKAMSQQHGH